MIVGHDAVPAGVGAGILRGRGDQVGVRVGHLAEAGPLPDLDQLAAGADHQHARTGPHEHPIASDRGEQRDLLRAERGAGTERRRIRRRGPRRHAGCIRRCAPGGGSSTRATPRLVSSSGMTASAPVGIGAPVMMRIARPGPMPERDFAPAATSPTTGSVAGSSARRVLGVDRAHGVAVHGGVVEAGQRDRRVDALGQQQPLRVEQGQLDRIDRPDAVEHRREVFVDGAQAVVVTLATSSTYSLSHAVNSAPMSGCRSASWTTDFM